MSKFLYLLLMLTTTTWAFAANGAEKNHCNDLTSTQWMQGQWQSNNEKTVITEQWQQTDDKTMVGRGISTRLKSNKPPFVESLRIVEMANEVFYLAKPPQNPVPVAFKLVECSASYLKFANPQHDFPQVIEYKKTTDNHMVAIVSGADNKGFQIDFTKQPADTNDHLATVRTYVEAYNQRNLEGMMKFTAPNIHWMSVAGGKVSVETNDRKALRAALKQHFSRARKSHSSLSGIAQYGDFVSAIEKVSSVRDGKPRSQCSLSVYQFDGTLIVRISLKPISHFALNRSLFRCETDRSFRS